MIAKRHARARAGPPFTSSSQAAPVVPGSQRHAAPAFSQTHWPLFAQAAPVLSRAQPSGQPCTLSTSVMVAQSVDEMRVGSDGSTADSEHRTRSRKEHRSGPE